jgi:hypothetical protein
MPILLIQGITFDTYKKNIFNFILCKTNVINFKKLISYLKILFIW